MDDVIIKRLKKINHIYLSGGAFGVIYQMGALNRLAKYYKKYNISQKPIIYGDSVGALIGVLFLLGMKSSKQMDIYMDVYKIATQRINDKPFTMSSYYLTEYPLKILRLINKEYPDAYRLVYDNIFIGVVLLHNNGHCEKKWYSKFKSQKEFFNILLCSFNIPFLSTYDAKIVDNGNTMLAMDGCLRQEKMPEGILRIINGNHQGELVGNISLYESLVPPTEEGITHYYEKGKEDMKKKICTGENTNTKSRNYFASSSLPLFMLRFIRHNTQNINTKHNVDSIFEDNY
jgi:hypothetical protein